jgi:hypothetical protein
VDQRRALARKPEANLTDPDWPITKTRTGWIQGFNGQLRNRLPGSGKHEWITESCPGKREWVTTRRAPV